MTQWHISRLWALNLRAFPRWIIRPIYPSCLYLASRRWRGRFLSRYSHTSRLVSNVSCHVRWLSLSCMAQEDSSVRMQLFHLPGVSLWIPYRSSLNLCQSCSISRARISFIIQSMIAKNVPIVLISSRFLWVEGWHHQYGWRFTRRHALHSARDLRRFHSAFSPCSYQSFSCFECSRWCQYRLWWHSLDGKAPLSFCSFLIASSVRYLSPLPWHHQRK